MPDTYQMDYKYIILCKVLAKTFWNCLKLFEACEFNNVLLNVEVSPIFSQNSHFDVLWCP